MADNVDGRDERIAKIQSELDELRSPLHDRVRKLEKAAESSTAEPEKWYWRVFDKIAPAIPQVIGGGLLIVIAFLVKEPVDLAIQERHPQLSCGLGRTSSVLADAVAIGARPIR